MRLFKRRVTPVGYKEMYQELFKSEVGRLVLSDLCRKFFALKSTAGLSGQVDANTVILNEGMRNVILYILTQVDYDVEALRNILSSHKLEVTNND